VEAAEPVPKQTLQQDLKDALAQTFYWWGGASHLGEHINAQVFSVPSAVPHLCVVFPKIRRTPESPVPLQLALVVFDGHARLAEQGGTPCHAMGKLDSTVEVAVPTDPRANVLRRKLEFSGPTRQRLEQGLRGIFFALGASPPPSGHQHFFVGPVAADACLLPVLWREQGRYWFLPICGAIFDAPVGVDYALAAPISLWKPLMRGARNSDAAIANMVLDGDLFELSP
jgi:hypothetical protein